jgi:hypothetical protein
MASINERAKNRGKQRVVMSHLECCDGEEVCFKVL